MTITALSNALDSSTLRRAFGAFPCGIVAVAAEVDGRAVGLAASSFTSVSIDPALVSFSVANTSSTWPALRRGVHLGLSVLADHHSDVCRQLAGPAEHRFDGLATTVSPDGALLMDEAVATFDCTIHREVEAGDHTIVLLQLHAVAVGDEDGDGDGGEPLVFHRSAFGSLRPTG